MTVAAHPRTKAPPTTRQWFGALALTALVNAPFWWLDRTFFLTRATFNLDLLLPLLLLNWSVWAGVASLVLCWLFDLIVSQSVAYHFVSAGDFLKSVRFATNLRLHDFVTPEHLLLALPFLLAVGGVIVIRRRVGAPGWSAPVVLLTLAVLADAVNGSSVMSVHQLRWTHLNISGSPFAVLAAGHRSGGPAPLIPARDPQARAMADELVDWASRQPQGNVAVVVMESLGVPSRPTLHTWLRAQLLSAPVPERYAVEERALVFRGATTYGELRTLCGVEGSYARIRDADMSACLPTRLALLGWDSVGFHGFSQAMFDRRDWWPLLGLSQQQFAEAMGPRLPRRCGSAFRGLCDNDVIALAARALDTPRRLVYVLTLNSHLPVESLPLPPELADICQQEAIEVDVCQFHAALGRALGAVRTELLVRPEARPLAVMVVGDHAPPFTRTRALAQITPGVVPAWLLLPRY